MLLKTEGDLKTLAADREHAKNAPRNEKMALYAGSATTLAGLTLASYTHSDVIFTPDNLTMSLLTLGSGMLLFATKNNPSFTNLFQKDKDSDTNSDQKSHFTFKLLNNKNAFSKELRAVDLMCNTAEIKWPKDVQDQLDSLVTKDIAALEKSMADKR